MQEMELLRVLLASASWRGGPHLHSPTVVHEVNPAARRAPLNLGFTNVRSNVTKCNGLPEGSAPGQHGVPLHALRQEVVVDQVKQRGRDGGIQHLSPGLFLTSRVARHKRMQRVQQ